MSEIMDEVNAFFNNEITAEDIIKECDLLFAGKTFDEIKINYETDINLNVFGKEVLYKKVERILSRIINYYIFDETIHSFSLVAYLIRNYLMDYYEDICKLIFNYIESKLEGAVSEQKVYGVYFNKGLDAFFLEMPEVRNDVEDLFKEFFKNKAEHIPYFINNLNNLKLDPFKMVNINNFNDSKLLNAIDITDDSESFFLYAFFFEVINSNNAFFIENVIDNKYDIFKYTIKLFTRYYCLCDIDNVKIKSILDKIIAIILKKFGPEKGNKYIKTHLFKFLTKSYLESDKGVFLFKEYKQYIPDNDFGKKVKMVLSINDKINKENSELSDDEITLIKSASICTQNKIILNPNISMKSVEKIVGNKVLNKSMLDSVMKARPNDYLDFYKLKVKNSMRNELNELESMGFIEDIIIDFKITKEKEDALKLYLNVKD